MRLDGNDDKIQELNNFMMQLLQDDSVRVDKLLHGYHEKQVHMFLCGWEDEGNNGMYFIELDISVPKGIGIYSSNVIEAIKRCVDKNNFKDRGMV